MFSNIGFGLTSDSHIILREYHYVNLKMNWTDAQQYCRVKYNDLATIESMDDISSPTSVKWSDALAYCRKHYKDMAMMENDQENTQMLSVALNLDVWIGLYRVSWRWSDNGSSRFRNWAYGEPNNYQGSDHCAVEKTNHLWADIPCARKLPFCPKNEDHCEDEDSE
ncbi:C-type lectin-like [Acanthochromis polyacanthus]|uniref:C-type lectin-like n=1 Tax=Acanthochromis polyacanthus TaxID=80966 RepID=UPI00223441AB|nr:C-type lectin-like [Acanthochromis polyacanthus]